MSKSLREAASPDISQDPSTGMVLAGEVVSLASLIAIGVGAGEVAIRGLQVSQPAMERVTCGSLSGAIGLSLWIGGLEWQRARAQAQPQTELSEHHLQLII